MAGDPFAAVAPFYDQVMRRVPYPTWVDYLELLLRQWGGEGGTVLDLACGTGSVGLELAARGRTVIGVDQSRPMLCEGLRRAADSELSMAFVQQDMAALGLARSFDLVVCLFDSLNYLLDLAALERAFGGVAAALRPGGLFIFDVNTERALLEEMFTQDDFEPETPVKLRWRSRYDKRSRIAAIEMEFYLPDGEQVRVTQHERAYSVRELRTALETAGFRTLAVYDAYTFNLPQNDSDRVFYVCRAHPEARPEGD